MTKYEDCRLPSSWNFDARISRITYFTRISLSLSLKRLLLVEKYRFPAIFNSRWKYEKRPGQCLTRGLFRSNRFLLPLPSPPPFFRVITDKRLKREFSTTNIDWERRKERERKIEGLRLSGNERHDLSSVRVAGKTISFHEDGGRAPKAYICIDRQWANG